MSYIEVTRDLRSNADGYAGCSGTHPGIQGVTLRSSPDTVSPWTQDCTTKYQGHVSRRAECTVDRLDPITPVERPLDVNVVGDPSKGLMVVIGDAAHPWSVAGGVATSMLVSIGDARTCRQRLIHLPP